MQGLPAAREAEAQAALQALFALLPITMYYQHDPTAHRVSRGGGGTMTTSMTPQHTG